MLDNIESGFNPVLNPPYKQTQVDNTHTHTHTQACSLFIILDQTFFVNLFYFCSQWHINLIIYYTVCLEHKSLMLKILRLNQSLTD